MCRMNPQPSPSAADIIPLAERVQAFLLQQGEDDAELFANAPILFVPEEEENENAAVLERQHRELLQRRQCPTCFVAFNRQDRVPKRLPCDHVACATCLAQYSGTVTHLADGTQEAVVICPYCSESWPRDQVLTDEQLLMELP